MTHLFKYYSVAFLQCLLFREIHKNGEVKKQLFYLDFHQWSEFVNVSFDIWIISQLEDQFSAIGAELVAVELRWKFPEILLKVSEGQIRKLHNSSFFEDLILRLCPSLELPERKSLCFHHRSQDFQWFPQTVRPPGRIPKFRPRK